MHAWPKPGPLNNVRTDTDVADQFCASLLKTNLIQHGLQLQLRIFWYLRAFTLLLKYHSQLLSGLPVVVNVDACTYNWYQQCDQVRASRPINFAITAGQTGNKIWSMMNPAIPEVIHSGFIPCLLFAGFTLACHHSAFDK